MKLVVLGGSAAGVNTGTGCAGLLLSDGRTSLVIDLGPGTLLELRKHVDYRTLDAIVISHYHLDHVLDIGALRFLGKYNPAPIGRKIPLRIPPGSADRFAAWSAAFASSDESEFLEAIFEIEEFDPAETLRVGAFSIRFARTVHPVPAWAMRISGSTVGDIGYTADTGPVADLAGFFNGVSLLVCEATEPADTRLPPDKRGHLTASEAARLAADTRARALILTHRWEELGLDRGALEAKEDFPGPVMVARPGLTVFV